MAKQCDDSDVNDDDSTSPLVPDIDEDIEEFPKKKCLRVTNFLCLVAMLGQAILITADSVFARLSMMGVCARARVCVCVSVSLSVSTSLSLSLSLPLCMSVCLCVCVYLREYISA